MSGKAGEKWSKLCNWGGWVSTLALILEGEMYLIFFGWSKFEPTALALKTIFLDLNRAAVFTKGSQC